MPELEAQPEADGKGLPDFKFILWLIAIPIGLILTGTVLEQMTASSLPEGLSNAERNTALTAAMAASSPTIQFFYFLSHPVIALPFVHAHGALLPGGLGEGLIVRPCLEISTKALGPAGIIILITGAGGVFKGVLKETGITTALAELFGKLGHSHSCSLAWIFATLVRIAQGSATVAMLTAAGLMAGFIDGLSQPQLALVTIVIAAGATGFSHVNDSGFWMISRYFRMSEAQTLRTWTIISTAISVIGFVFALILWMFV